MRQKISTYYSMTLEDCTDFLHSKKLNFKKKYYNIKISGKISPEPIREMVKLPYEISIYNFKGENRLMTGTRHGTSEEDFIVVMMKRSVFNIHTHPREISAKFDAPSFSDLLYDFPERKKRAIAHCDGMLIYGRCLRDTKNNILSYRDAINDEYLEDMVDMYLRSKGISLFRNLPKHRMLENVSLSFQSQYSREFADLTELIKDEVRWDDKKGIRRIMKKIFHEHA